MPVVSNPYRIMNEKKEMSNTAKVVAKTMYAAMQILKGNDGSMPFSQLRDRVAQQVEFTEWESAVPSPKTSSPRWEINMAFYAIDYSEAGLIRKESGTWYLTSEGVKALSLSAEKVFEMARTAYRMKQGLTDKGTDVDSDVEEIAEPTDGILLADAESLAMDGIRKHIESMNPYAFQELVAALLRSMGYYTPFIADKGRDGGIDVIAYENAAGIGSRVIVQVKHTPTMAQDITTVRNLTALLKKETDIGWVATSGRFTSEAKRFARECKNNVRLIDGEELVRLWIMYQDRLTPSDKALMPLHAVYFIEQ